MSEMRNDPHVDAWRLFITLYPKIIEIIDTDLQSAGGIPLQQYDVLIELFEAEGKALRMHELAEKVVLSRSSITRIVDQLAKAGYLTRRPDPVDRRGSFAVLTREGEIALRESWPHYREAIHQHFGSFLDKKEAKIIYKAFSRMHKAINEE